MPDVQGKIVEARTAGFATAYDIVMPDTGAIAMPLKERADGKIMIVGVAGLNHRIRAREASILKIMRTMIDSVP